MHEHSVTGPCTFGQIAAAEALRDNRTQEFVRMMVSEYEKRRDIIVQELEKIDVISCVKPRGAFYAFPNISSIEKDSTVLANYLLEKAKVVTIPGIVFGPCGEGHLRITFTNPEHELREAMRRIGEALKEYA